MLKNIKLFLNDLVTNKVDLTNFKLTLIIFNLFNK